MWLLLLAGCAAPVGSVGAVLYREPATGALYVREAPEGMGAAQAGLRPGDEVVSIDGEDARGLSRQEVHERLKGAVGTRVELTVVREGRVERLVVRRGPYRRGK